MGREVLSGREDSIRPLEELLGQADRSVAIASQQAEEAQRWATEQSLIAQTAQEQVETIRAEAQRLNALQHGFVVERSTGLRPGMLLTVQS